MRKEVYPFLGLGKKDANKLMCLQHKYGDFEHTAPSFLPCKSFWSVSIWNGLTLNITSAKTMNSSWNFKYNNPQDSIRMWSCNKTSRWYTWYIHTFTVKQLKNWRPDHFGYTCRLFSCYAIAAMLEEDNKRFHIIAFSVSSSNMAATSLSFDSLEIDCKPSIGKTKLTCQTSTEI